MRSYGGILLILFVLASAGIVQAGDVPAGKAKSIACLACHGIDGIGTNPQRPNLAGQKAHYLSQQLRAFRDGDRVDPAMNAVAKMLSDADIENLAAYYSSLSNTGKPE
ncbi:MAG: cytochrome c [Candidatus Competibacteraceae bacterium]|nr:cytochrome c [Candidatus Competibacteraceae bacterium]